MTRIAARLLVAALGLSAYLVLPASSAQAQVVVQGEATVYTGTTTSSGGGYVQEGSSSPYVGGGAATTPQPTRVIVNTEPTMALLVPGIIAFGAGWLLHGIGSLSIAQDGCAGFGCPQPLDDWVGLGWIPLVGPWLAATLTDAKDYIIFNVLMGIMQGVGAVLAILGLAIQQEWEEPVYALGDAPDAPVLSFQVGAASLGATLAF